jgi:HK97 family phage major capsid protein
MKQSHDARVHALELHADKQEVAYKQMRGAPIVSGPREYFPGTLEQKEFSDFLHRGGLVGPELKSLRVGDATLGGYFAPDEYSSRVIEKLTEISPLRQLAYVQPTSAATLEIPKETGDFEGAWVGEVGERTETTGETFGLEKIPAHEFYALVKVSRQLIEDSQVNLDEFLLARFARKLNKLEGAAFVSGNAIAKPEGILTNANVGYVISGDANLITADGLVNLAYSLPTDYRKGASFIMNRATIGTIRKLKETGTGAYLWERSYATGQPETLLGYPIYEAVDMPDVAANAFPVVFGDFRLGYTIADRIDLQVQVLREKYVEFGLFGYMARKRVGGQVVLPEAIRKLKIAAA